MPALRLADIHGAIGLIERMSGIRPRIQDGDAGRGAGMDRTVDEREAQTIDGLLERSRLGAGLRFIQIPQQHAEFVASEPANHVGGTHMLGESPGNCLQHLVARGVTECVVDRLETIDVEHDQRGGGMVTLDIADRAVELAGETTAIEDVEQKIPFDAVLQNLDPLQRPRQFRLEPADDPVRAVRVGESCFGRFGIRLALACVRVPDQPPDSRAALRGAPRRRHALLFHRIPCRAHHMGLPEFTKTG